MASDERTCPECAETIKAAAKVCRYCGYRIADNQHASSNDDQAAQVSPASIKQVEQTLPDAVHSSASDKGASQKPTGASPPNGIGWWDRTFDDGPGAKRGCLGSMALLAVVLCLTVATCSLSPSTDAPPTPIAEQEQVPPSATAAYTTDQLSMICRAGIAAEFARSPKIMTAREIEPGMMRIEYRRPNDPKLWKNDCRVEGNRIVWRTVDASPGSGAGRWRTTENDDVLTFKLEGNAVTTESSDGSSASETYRF